MEAAERCIWAEENRSSSTRWSLLSKARRKRAKAARSLRKVWVMEDTVRPMRAPVKAVKVEWRDDETQKPKPGLRFP